MNAIVQYTDPALDDVKRLANLVLALRDDVFKEKLDYGIIPGTGDKPTLLLPGMEKLMRALRLRAEYIERQIIRDYDRPLFHYEYECRLVEYETNICVSTAVGMASSFEKKWRWRQSDRVCPHCGLAAIIKGQEKYGGGWLCFAKKGGCGAKFKDGDKSIEGQSVGRVENEDIFDQINTISKIAQKRALSSAIKGAANVSEFFTVDLEDFQNYEVSAPQSIIVEGRIEEAPRTAPQSSASVQSPPPSENRPPEALKDTHDYFSDASSQPAPDEKFLGFSVVAVTRVGKNGRCHDLILNNGARVTIYTRDPLRALSPLWADTVKTWDEPGTHAFLDIAGELDVYSTGKGYAFGIPDAFANLHAVPDEVQS
jgi:hypothetical protein